ncbi:hypothetical protein HAX54_029892 [Datura stramonium]|uniref:Uncharacterized protein n=1 Tax=Datura stramonium TaxID=4076 RepID=A0ABS8V731_DATST|nr:hypothetical protein [Datura stramonium]
MVRRSYHYTYVGGHIGLVDEVGLVLDRLVDFQLTQKLLVPLGPYPKLLITVVFIEAHRRRCDWSFCDVGLEGPVV